MNKKDLIDLGIAEDVAEKVVVLHGKDIESHKTKIADLQTQFDGVSAQLTEAGATIEGFKKLDVDAIQKAADEYKAKFEEAQTTAAAQIENLKQDHALERDLKEKYKVKPKEILSIKAHLKMDTLKYDPEKDSFTGLDEQMIPIKSERDYLFSDAQPAPRIVTGGNSKSVVGDPVIDAARKAAQLPTT